MTLDLDAIRRRNPGNADVKALLAEVIRLRQACDIFEKNSEGAVKLEEALRACLPILAVVGVPQMHHDCSDNCRGCQLAKDRDAVLHQAWEALGVKEEAR